MNLKINQKPFAVLLIQDGTLDAVLRVKDILSGEIKILRFSPGTVARTQWGTLPADVIEKEVKKAFGL
jgi:hypothetical protein